MIATKPATDLAAYLRETVSGGTDPDVARIVQALVGASASLAAELGRGPVLGDDEWNQPEDGTGVLGASRQRLDLVAPQIFMKALNAVPVQSVMFAERAGPKGL